MQSSSPSEHSPPNHPPIGGRTIARSVSDSLVGLDSWGASPELTIGGWSHVDHAYGNPDSGRMVSGPARAASAPLVGWSDVDAICAPATLGLRTALTPRARGPRPASTTSLGHLGLSRPQPHRPSIRELRIGGRFLCTLLCPRDGGHQPRPDFVRLRGPRRFVPRKSAQMPTLFGCPFHRTSARKGRERGQLSLKSFSE